MTRQEALQAVTDARAAEAEANRVLREATKSERDANALLLAVMANEAATDEERNSVHAARRNAWTATDHAIAALRDAEEDYNDAVATAHDLAEENR